MFIKQCIAGNNLLVFSIHKGFFEITDTHDRYGTEKCFIRVRAGFGYANRQYKKMKQIYSQNPWK